jgi:hypothetical protein
LVGWYVSGWPAYSPVKHRCSYKLDLKLLERFRKSVTSECQAFLFGAEAADIVSYMNVCMKNTTDEGRKWEVTHVDAVCTVPQNVVGTVYNKDTSKKKFTRLLIM